MSSSLREFPPQFWAVAAATFLGFLGIATVLPELGPHVRNDLGRSDETVGFVVGIFSFVALAARLVSGPLADRRGRKLVFAVGLLSCALAGAAYLAPLGIGGVYLARILHGFGEACLYTGAATWAVELAGVHRSSLGVGYISWGIWGGMSSGPVLGHWVGSFQHAAMTQMILAAAGFVLLARVKESYKPHRHAGKRNWLPRSILAPGFAIGFVNVHYPVITGFIDSVPGTARKLGTRGVHGLCRRDPVLALLSRKPAGPSASAHHLLHGACRDDDRIAGARNGSLARDSYRRRGRARVWIFSFSGRPWHRWCCDGLPDQGAWPGGWSV